MNKIEKSFVENAQKDKNLLRQYIGTYSGVTRLYPSWFIFIIISLILIF